MTPAELLALQERMWNLGRFVVTRRGPDAKAVQRDAIKATTEVDRLCIEVEVLRMQLTASLQREQEMWRRLRGQLVVAEYWTARSVALESLVRHVQHETGEQYLDGVGYGRRH